ncbi:MAG: Stp1/IreP family PP2C-type Ser/Thr phosphatase [Clostridium sp.]|nr:Stp1/IreP family PP2C-type Ser/Thr phosphatase [Clostridium sp.]
MNRQNNNNYDYCILGEATDVGQRRSANEDSCGNGLTINGLVATVCDGMGGHVGGATASKIAVETIFDVLNNRFFDDPREAIGVAIDRANEAILQYAAEHPELQGMGSTCVLLIVRDGKVYIGHVGDSRIYLIRRHTIKQLTTDHSYVQMLVDSGTITPEEAERHPRKNEITNALGIPTMQPATVKPEPITPEIGDCFLLCSDGLSGMVPNNKIERVISDQRNMHLQDRAEKLVRMANEAGGVDNISVELVEFADLPGTKQNLLAEKKKMATIGICAALLVIALLAVWFVFIRDTKSTDPATGDETQTADTTAVRTDTVAKPGGEIIGAIPNDQTIDLGKLGMTPKQAFMTLNFKKDGTEITTSAGTISNGFIGDPMKIDLEDDRLKRNLTDDGKKCVVTVLINKAPNPKDGFVIVIPSTDGKSKLTLKFQLVETQKPAVTPATPEKPDEVKPNIDDNPQDITTPEKKIDGDSNKETDKNDKNNPPIAI